MMKIITTKDYEEMSLRASEVILEQLTMKKNMVLGLASGSSPVGTYEQLTAACRRGEADFSKVTTFNLDEYVGSPENNSQSFRFFMNEKLFNHINIDMGSTHVPDGMAEDLQAACSAYDEMLLSCGGTDLQLLGIGHNGHIGFNEPGESFIKETHTINLTQETITANARFFQDPAEVPRSALTMGFGAIMSAKKILLVVSGADKAPALSQALYGPITPMMPASILQLHPDVTVIADQASMGAF